MQSSQIFVAIPIASIQVPESAREIKREAVEKLKESFRLNESFLEGPINPIIVRPHPDSTHGFQYMLVAGRHRMVAAEELGAPTILARVCNVSEPEARCITLAENLFRVDGNHAEKLLWLQEWQQVRDQRVSDEQVRSRYTPKGKRKPGEEPAQSFAEEAAAATGLSPEYIERQTQVANRIGKENLERLMKVQNITKEDLQALSELDDERIHDACKRAGSGLMSMPDAIRAAKEETLSIEDLGPGRKLEHELDDEEWLTTYCGRLLGLLGPGCLRKYRREALIYRHTNAARQAFRNKAKPAIAMSKSDEEPGPLCMAYSRVVNLSHPSDWLMCGKCQGTGQTPQIGRCGECYGAGYRITTESRHR